MVMKESIRNLFIDCTLPRQDISLFPAVVPVPSPQETMNPTEPSFSSIGLVPAQTADPTFVSNSITAGTPFPTTEQPVAFAFPLPMTEQIVDVTVTAPPSPSTTTILSSPTTPILDLSTPAPSADPLNLFFPPSAPNTIQDPSCSANVLCQVRGLEGDCCPTPEGVDLDCCGSIVIETCMQNSQCSSLGLTGACCPTSDKVRFLDCCDSVPDICLGGDDPNCVIFSALEYIDELAAQASRASCTATSVSVLLATLFSLWVQHV